MDSRSESVLLHPEGLKLGVKSFVDVIKNTTNHGEAVLAGFSNIDPIFHNTPEEFTCGNGVSGFKIKSQRQEKTAIILSEKDVEDLAKPLRLTLIGKFPGGRPRWEAVQSVFKAMKLQGNYRCVHLDVRHVVIHLSNPEDYIRLFSRQSIFIQGFLLKFFKWTTDFSVNAESSFAPVWISFPLIRLHLYNRAMLYSIAAVYGTPLKLDHATSHWLRPERARILVEMDLKKRFDNELWIGTDTNGYLQQVIFENFPGFCFHCKKIGHYDATCFHLHPELKSDRDIKKRVEKTGKVLPIPSVVHNPVNNSVKIVHQTGVQFGNDVIHEIQLGTQKNSLITKQLSLENSIALRTESIQVSQNLVKLDNAVLLNSIANDVRSDNQQFDSHNLEDETDQTQKFVCNNVDCTNALFEVQQPDINIKESDKFTDSIPVYETDLDGSVSNQSGMLKTNELYKVQFLHIDKPQVVDYTATVDAVTTSITDANDLDEVAILNIQQSVMNLVSDFENLQQMQINKQQVICDAVIHEQQQNLEIPVEVNDFQSDEVIKKMDYTNGSASCYPEKSARGKSGLDAEFFCESEDMLSVLDIPTSSDISKSWADEVEGNLNLTVPKPTRGKNKVYEPFKRNTRSSAADFSVN